MVRLWQLALTNAISTSQHSPGIPQILEGFYACPPRHAHTNGKRLQQVIRKVGSTNTRPVIVWKCHSLWAVSGFLQCWVQSRLGGTNKRTRQNMDPSSKKQCDRSYPKKQLSMSQKVFAWVLDIYACYVLHLFSVLPAVQRNPVLFWNITSSILSFTEAGKSSPLIPKALLCYFSERIIQRPLRNGACWYAHTVPKQGSRWSCP